MTTTDPDQMSKRERSKTRRAEKKEAERKAAARQAWVTRGIVALVGIVLIGVIVVLANVLTSDGSALDVGNVEATASVVEGAPLPPFGGESDPAVGQPAPTMEGVSFEDGAEPVQFGGTGQPQLVSFMAHWCPHCQNDLPLLVDAKETGQIPDGVEVVAVSTLQDPAKPNWGPKAWLSREGFDGTVVVDNDQTAIQTFGISGTPGWVAIDAQGNVVGRASGEIGEDRMVELAQLAAGEAAPGSGPAGAEQPADTPAG